MTPVTRTHLRHLLTLTLVSLQIWTPLLSRAWADEISPLVPTSAGTTLDKAANGVPIVNIAAPGAAGISHNRYSQFDVDRVGLILNNSGQPVNTQLGGFIPGNGNLGSRAARLILNEVTSAHPSQLNGYMEVAGQKADVVVANPYGITCRGCGFINTSRATLSTGKAVLANDGSLGGFTVENGVLRIDGEGLNATNTESLALYARVLELNAALYANELQVAIGANSISAITGVATPLNTTTAAPAYAIDSSALGGMYANTIRLVGTEAGVGMRLAGPVAALTGKLEISANGDVHLARVSSAGAMALTSSGQMGISDAITAEGPLTSQSHALTLTDTASLSADQTTLQAQTALQVAAGASIAARGDLSLNAASLGNAGQIGSLGHVQVNSTTVTNSGQLEAQQTLQLSSHQLTTTAGSRLGAVQAVTLNLGELAQAGLLSAGSTLQIDANGAVRNSGMIEANSGLNLKAASFTNPGQMTVSAGALALEVQGLLNNQGGQIRHSGAPFTLSAGVFDNSQQGRLSSSGPMTLSVSGDLLNNSGTLQSEQALTLSSAGLHNNAGQLLAGGPLHMALSSGVLNNAAGTLTSAAALTLTGTGAAGGINNAGGHLLAKGAMHLSLQSGGLDNAGGDIKSEGDWRFSSAGRGNLNNSTGHIISNGDAQLQLAHGFLNNANGVLQGTGALSVTALGQADTANNSINNQGGEVLSKGAMTLEIGHGLSNALQGHIQSEQHISITSAGAGDVSNDNGKILSKGAIDVILAGGHISNRSAGEIRANAAITLGGALSGVVNTNGYVIAGGPLAVSVATGTIQNQGGMLRSDTAISLHTLGAAGDIDNSGNGNLLSVGALTLTADHGIFNNTLGLLQSNSAVEVSSAGLVNSQGTISSQSSLMLDAHDGALNNNAGHLLGGSALAHYLRAQSLDNKKGEIALGNGMLDMQLPGVLDNRDGQIKHTGSALNLSASGLDNQRGTVATMGVLTLALHQADALSSPLIGTTSLLNNGGTLQGNTGLTLSSAGWDNSHGHALSSGTLHITLNDQALDNSDGIIESAGTLSLSQLADVNNSRGKLLADGDISVSLAQHALNNDAGLIETTQNLTVSNAASLQNQGGTLRATNTLNLDLPTFTSSTVGGLIRAAGALNLHSRGAIDMDAAEFSTPGALWLDAGAADITIRHRVLSGGDLRLSGNAITVGDNGASDDGFVASQAGLFVTANSVSNDGVLYGQDGVDLKVEDFVTNGDATNVVDAAIVSNGDISITRQDGSQLITVNNYAGQIESLNGNVTIKAATINNINLGWAVATETVEEKPVYYHDDYSPTGQRSDIVHSDEIAHPEGSYYWSLTWNDAIAGYPRNSAENSCSNGACYYFFRDKETLTHRNVSRQGDQAHIMASAAPASGKGNIWLEADTVNNNRSVISATGLLDIDVGMSGGSINNVATVLFDVSDINRETRWKSCGRSGACARGQDIIDLATNDLASRQDQRIPAILEGGLLVNLHGTVVNGAPENTGHTVSTGLGAFIDPNRPTTAPTDTTAQGGNNASTISTQDPTGVAAVGGGVGGVSGPVSVTAPAGVAPLLPAIPLDPTAAPGFHLPGNGIFHLDTNPGHPYLVETDPALNTYTGFLGSSYLIEHLNWQPTITQRRLGDSYYELQLVRTTLLASLGTRFIDPNILDERQQFEHLMNNAIAASGALQLSPGISLSRSQIDALEQDIIWMEEKTVAGHKVLVPVVYLAQGSSRLLSDGAVIGGGNITIDGSEFKNAGLVRSGNKINITSTKAIENIGGTIQAVGDITLDSGGDILNESGTISGHDVTLLAEGDIINRTWHEDEETITGAYEEKVKKKDGSYKIIKHEGNSQWSTRVGDTASITATGHLIQQAVNDILIEGGALSGEDIALIAGNDVTISAIEALQGYKFSGVDWQQSEEHVRQLQSTITSALDLSISADNNLTAIAAELNAGGNATLHAGNNVSLLAATESDHSESHSRDKKGSSDYIDDRQRNLGTRLTAGGNLEITADQGNVNLYASSAVAKGDVDVSAGGDVNVIAGIDSAYHSESEVKKSDIKISTHKEGYSQQTAAQSGIVSGGNLTLKAGGDVTLTASTLAAKDTLNIGDAKIDGGVLIADTAAGTIPHNVNVNSLALTNETWNESSSGYRGIGKELMRVAASLAASVPGGDNVKIDLAHHANDRTKDVLQAGSTLAATSLDINAKDTVSLISANVDVTEHASINATDIVFGTAVETHTTRHDVGSDDVVGLGAKLGKDEVRVGGAQETKHSLVDSTTLTHHKGSTLNAGTLSLTAKNNIEAYNADITVTGDASLTAGNQLIIGGKEDVLTNAHKEVTEVITVAAAVRNAYVDAALTVKAMADAREAIKDAKKALNDAEDKASRGELDPDDVKYFRINLEAAKANLAQMGVAMVAALAMGAAAAGTGFYASGSAQRDKTTTTSTTSEGSWQGSTLTVGGNADLSAGEKIKIQGSDIDVKNTLTVNAKKIELLAGEEHYASTSKTTQEHEGFSISSSGGGSANASLRQTDADASGTHYVNAHLTAGTLNSNSDSLRIAGGMIEADHVAIDTQKLTVVSVQDTYQSKSKTVGMGVGISGGKGGVSGGSLSGEFQKSTSEKAWVAEQSGIIGHNTITVKAEDTVLTGAIIANAKRDDSLPSGRQGGGELIDQGHLKLITNTLQVNDLLDVDKAKTVGGNFAVSLPLGGGKASSTLNKTGGPAHGTPSNAPAGNTSTDAANNVAKKGAPFNTLTVGGVYHGHTTERTSHATLGLGDIVIGGETLTDDNQNRLISTTTGSTLNRDLNNAQEITKDQDIGGLNASVTVDGRWLSDAGRKEMVQQVRDAGKNGQIVADKLATDIDPIVPSMQNENTIFAGIGKAISYLGLPTVENEGGALGDIFQIAGSQDIHTETLIISRDNADPMVTAAYAPANMLDGYTGLEALGREYLDNRSFLSIDSISADNATQHYSINGMNNTLAAAMVNGIEQNSQISALNIRTVAAVTQSHNGSHGLLPDIVDSAIVLTNGLANAVVLKPLGNLFGQSWSVAVTGDTKQQRDFITQINNNVAPSSPAYLVAHSEANLQSWVAFQVLGDNALKKDDNGKPLINVGSYGSPVFNRLMQSSVENAGGAYQGSATNPHDFVSNGLGANTTNYVNSPNLSAGQTNSMGQSTGIPVVSTITHAWDALGLLDDKYPVYKNSITGSDTYVKPATDAKPINDVSAHSGYTCLPTMNCASAFGGLAEAVPDKGLVDKRRKENQSKGVPTK